jgi:hypothetical protein
MRRIKESTRLSQNLISAVETMALKKLELEDARTEIPQVAEKVAVAARAFRSSEGAVQGAVNLLAEHFATCLLDTDTGGNT